MEQKKVFEGKAFDFIAMPTLTIGGWGVTFMFRQNWKTGNWIYCDPGAKTNFWMKDLKDEFQNPENLCKGLEYVDGMPDCSEKKKVMEIISSMMGKTGGPELKKLGFMCELGCWENPKLRQSNLYDEDFSKYVKNCLEVYPV